MIKERVIFSQRLKILKDDNIENILEDFFDEILVDLEEAKVMYQKSNDEKNYLTSIKNTIGNIFTDKELINMASFNKEKFYEKIKDVYQSKKKQKKGDDWIK